MDTSEIYIKRCDCDEVQDLITEIDLDNHSFWWIITKCLKCPKCRNYRSGKYCNTCRRKLIIEEDGYVDNEENRYHQSIWLPRQDQIQGMMDYDTAYNLGEHFWEFVFNHRGWIKDKDTMEQLWLAFYMWEKHGKIWDGKKWVKKEE